MVNARKSESGGEYEITFTFRLEEIIAANMTTDFARVWYGSKRPSEFVELLKQLILSQRRTQERASNPYADLFGQRPYTQEDVQNLFRQKMGSFDFGGFQGAARTRAGAKPPPQPEPAWCKVLGLPKTATKEEIKAKHRQLVKVHHPDRRGGSPARFHEIQSAYEEAMEYQND